MSTNRIGQLAWVFLFLAGLYQIVDIGFGPIGVCPQCGVSLKAILAVVSIGVSAAAFFTNRVTADRVAAAGH
jgi:hypothetical protein